MVKLAQHIEILLLENDCVVVPGFGGFIAHSMPAVWDKTDNLFIPPTRVIGFNPQLKMNDGLLVQSYMEANGASYPEANQLVDKDVRALTDLLQNEGKAELPYIGEIHCSANNIYTFSPYDNRLTSPSYYGLDSFEIKELDTLRDEEYFESAKSKKRKPVEIFTNPWFRNAVAVVAAVVLFFYMSTPIENTYIENENYAHVMPTELFDKIKNKSLITTIVNTGSKAQAEIIPESVTVNDQATATEEVTTEQPADAKQTDETDQSVVLPVKTKEVKVAKTENKPAETDNATPIVEELNYHLIVASVTKQDDGQKMVDKLHELGYQGAKVISGDGRIRVSIASYATRKEAANELLQLRRIEKYSNAWLLIK